MGECKGGVVRCDICQECYSLQKDIIRKVC